MNGLYILIPDTSHMLAAEHPPRDISTPALSDDTGSSSSRESSRPATPTSGVSRAPSISFDDYSKHTHAGEVTDIKIVEADANSPLPEDITHPLKRRRLTDTRADEVRAERALLPNVWSDPTRADDGALFGLGHTPISDCTSVGDVEPDAVDPSLEYVSRPLKRKRSADTSTYDIRAKRVRTSGTSNDATKAEDRACFGLGHIPIHDYTKIRVVEPDADPPVAAGIDIHVPLDAIARPPKRKRCANTTADEVRVKRRRLSDSPSDASKLKDGIPFGPHPRCMITGCVSAEVEACYILPPDTPQPLGDRTMPRVPTESNAVHCSTSENIIFLRRDLRIVWETNHLLMIPHPDHIDHPDTRPVCMFYTYHVIAEDEQPSNSGTPQDHTIIPLATTADCSYRSLGWHELSANLHLMTIRVGRVFIKRPLHYEHALSNNLLVHIPTIALVHPDALEPVSPHIEGESPVEGIPRLPKRKRSPETDIDEVPVKRMRTSVTGCNASNIKDAVRFGPHPRCMITGCVSADVEGCYIWPLDMPQRLAYKYCVIAEDEHPPDSCATMGNPITPAVMAAPCSYRSLGWHKFKADLRLMVFRAGQKLSKRPFHYQRILRQLLPHKEINHTHTIVSRYSSWTVPLNLERVRGRRLWATGELTPFPDGYFRSPRKQYCPPLSDDDTARLPCPLRPIVSGIKRKRSGDARADSEVYTTEENVQQKVSICLWRRYCDQARDEWTMGPPAEPEDADLLAYRQEEAGDMLPAAQRPWFAEWHSSNRAIGCISEFPSGRCGNYMRGPCETPNSVYQPPHDDILRTCETIYRPYVDQPLGIGSSYGCRKDQATTTECGDFSRTCSSSSPLAWKLLYTKAMLLQTADAVCKTISFILASSQSQVDPLWTQSRDEWFQTPSVIGLSTNGAPVYTSILALSRRDIGPPQGRGNPHVSA
ncbi:predicted protein [Postia placenta Mad-698-R]|uniref:Uncharacterized protein n=1 Tax=Postia placenta MAD-698-R-SB12 TaxID=670580 RepID=A0A1X6N4R2_9APHY|nr:hypothetical protein POSPLADRAFT_1139247 [Postia placenta MAD-698-R-SB12]EED84967.1 predicted protein [Postia placenta Mad-698-R]OSX63598.1 hypothetical protein POSPLADRAFT_1139247 [Postia placenta MAD-698-R-SB12]